MKIIIGGQLAKEQIKKLILAKAPHFEVEISSDLEAAMQVQNQQGDYYFGACDTGGGGALAMAISLLGIEKAQTIATISSQKTKAEIKQMLEQGVIAFGFVENKKEWAVSTLVELLLEGN